MESVKMDRDSARALRRRVYGEVKTENGPHGGVAHLVIQDDASVLHIAVSISRVERDRESPNGWGTPLCSLTRKQAKKLRKALKKFLKATR